MDPVTIKIQFDIESTDADCALALEVFLDDQLQVRHDHVQKQTVILDLDDSVAAEHELRLEMSGKTWAHTQIDQQGNIIKDAALKISDVSIDEIDSTGLFYTQGIYFHDFNGNALVKYQVPFDGVMGCNGTVLFKFKTPYYQWILENL